MAITRRDFLKRLGIGGAAVAAASVLPGLPAPELDIEPPAPAFEPPASVTQPIITTVRSEIHAGDLVVMTPDGRWERATPLTHPHSIVMGIATGPETVLVKGMLK